jgi:hypothetical protein
MSLLRLWCKLQVPELRDTINVFPTENNTDAILGTPSTMSKAEKCGEIRRTSSICCILYHGMHEATPKVYGTSATFV